MRRGEAGMTLIEVLVAVTLFSLLSLGMVLALRVGLAAYSKTETKLMDNRRVAGAQRIVQAELSGLMPSYVLCGAGQGGAGARAVLFQGAPDSMWLVSTFSLEQGWRGQPQILQLFVIPGDDSGVRLVVNEIPYTGAKGAGQYCTGTIPIPNTITRLAQMIPTHASIGKTFVLADKLAACHFSYYTPSDQMNAPPAWQPSWASKGWPLAIRIEMAPEAPDPSRLQPISITAPLHIRRDADKVYTDDN